MKYTIRDIASMTGVSPTTVSFIINGKGKVGEETRKRVEKAIQETNFRPSINSRRLSTRKSYNICVVQKDRASIYMDMFYLGITRGVQQAAKSIGYNIVLADLTDGMPEIISNKDTDGIVFFQDLDQPILREIEETNLPYVVADTHFESPSYASVGIDYRQAANLAIRYLVDHGHREIALICDGTYAKMTDSIVRGFRDAMNLHHMDHSTDAVRSISRPEELAGTVLALLASPNRPSALFIPSDHIASDVLHILQRNGYRIPDDVSVISIDDTPLCQHVYPSLTSVHTDILGIGIRSMELLQQMIQGGGKENIVICVDHITQRDSVKMISRP